MTSERQSLDLQDRLLPGVSRTFALTIPQLPDRLRIAVTNAYLLCRIADTIEDDVGLESRLKQQFHQQFVEVVSGTQPAGEFAAELHPRLSPLTPDQERELIRHIPEVVGVTHGLNEVQRQALLRCIQVMCDGMPGFQHDKTLSGLRSVEELERYCYFVAGVVGEMLTDLFCEHSDEIAVHRERMMPLAVSFGQGLQMTNILKDFWEDRAAQTCWLPAEVFSRHGVDLARADAEQFQPGFIQGIRELIGIAHGCLRDSIQYVRLIPPREAGIRRFCLWAIGLAVLTLQNIRRRPAYRTGTQVKVSRGALRATVLMSNLSARYNAAVSMLFQVLTMGLPADMRVRSSGAGGPGR